MGMAGLEGPTCTLISVRKDVFGDVNGLPVLGAGLEKPARESICRTNLWTDMSCFGDGFLAMSISVAGLTESACVFAFFMSLKA